MKHILLISIIALSGFAQAEMHKTLSNDQLYQLANQEKSEKAENDAACPFFAKDGSRNQKSLQVAGYQPKKQVYGSGKTIGE